ncbi:MAG: VWA domain-containing protein [Kofleriaceae bacterium]
MRIASLTLLLSACASQGTSFYGGDDTPIDNGGGGSGACSLTAVTIAPVQPLIQLVVDGSGSMGQENINGGGTSKYGAVKKALYDTGNGNVPVLTSYLGLAKFGATAYNNSNQCPTLYTSDCTISNGAGVKTAIDKLNNQFTGQDPIAKTLQAMAATPFAATDTDPVRAVVIVTDGTANTCGNQGQDDSQNTFDAVDALYTLGVKTYIIGLEPDDGLGNFTTFQQTVADKGVGGAGGTTHTGDSQANLNAGYMAIFDELIDCSFTTTETLDVNDASHGTVSYDGTALATSDWTIVDNHTIKLSTDKCAMYKAATTTPVITASLCTD